MGRDIMSLPSAWSVYARLLASDRFSFVLEPFGLDATWAELCRPFGVSPKVVMDAYLAAFAKTGGYRLVSMDEGFAQYSGIVWENPCSRQEV